MSGNVTAETVDLKNLRFTHLSARNWRNFIGLDADLQKRMFLIGPNASGKSNLLDCFRFFAETVSVGGGFEAAIKRRGGVAMLRALAARRHPSISMSVALGNDNSPREWEYELTFRQDNQRRPIIEKEIVKFPAKCNP